MSGAHDTVSPAANPLESVLRRDRVIVATGLAVIGLIAAVYTVLGPGMPMSALHMTTMPAMPDMGGMAMAPAVWTPRYFVLVFLMWWVMMIAMMVPAAAPVVLLHAAVVRHAGGRALPGTAAFTAGYLVAWAGFALLATAAQWALELRHIVHPMAMSFTSQVLGGTFLVAAGLYQFTPLKRACLAHCRHPARFLVEHRRPGRFGAFVMGLDHGAYCLGCCWLLMVLLFVGGIMNLYWIAGLALLVLAEKVLPHGDRLGRIAGLVLVAWGGWLLATAAGVA